MRRDELQTSDIRRLLRNASELELPLDAVQKLKWFLFAAEHDGNVSLTCRHFGISRSTYLRWVKRFDAADVRTLEEQSRSPRTVREPETDPAVVQKIAEIRRAQPTMCKEAVVEFLKKNYGVRISSSTVGRVIKRHCLFFGDSPSHRAKRSNGNTVMTIPYQPINELLPSDDGGDGLFLIPGVTS